MSLEDFKIYLPKYLSAESESELFEGLTQFSDNIDERLFTNYLLDNSVIYQGDGINDLMIVNLPDVERKEVPCIIISNTCDIYPKNKRNFPSQIVYSPLIELSKYYDSLVEDLPEKRLQSHIDAIKRQRITQIFYLPTFENRTPEYIVFLDRLFNIGNDYVEREELKERRLFTLSDYGAYLFLYKLSIHFTRMQDKVERKSLRL